MNPGREENSNGRQFNWRAANGNWHNTVLRPDWQGRNLHARGYWVVIGKNSRDNGAAANKQTSINFASTMHVVTHTNGTTSGATRCAGSTNHFAAMYGSGSAKDQSLTTTLGTHLNAAIPGSGVIQSDVQYFGSTLVELGRNAVDGDAYIELQMHDYQPTQTWLFDQSRYVAWLYGFAIDLHLNYP